jgi:hypothetical protein
MSMKMWFLEMFGICFASHDVFARQQQLPNCTLFQTVLHDDVFGEGFGEKRLFSGLAFLQNTGMMHLQHMQMHVDVDEFIFVLFQLEFAWFASLTRRKRLVFHLSASRWSEVFASCTSAGISQHNSLLDQIYLTQPSCKVGTDHTMRATMLGCHVT